ncbi:MAG: thioesterase family protein [Eubacterium sp.]|nr:thioesterase family protein [Eubacterium sp.]
MLETGIKGTKTVIVNESNTAKTMGSGTLEVFATPALIALMEETCWRSVAGELEEGCGTVGTLLEIRHTAPTPVGMEVTCESTLVEVDGRRLVFEVTASDAKGVVGEGKHERFIIQNEKFQMKANAKLI